MKSGIRKIAGVFSMLLFAMMVWGLAEELYKIPVEHNHVKGECQGTLIVRDDKVIFESPEGGHGRIWEYGAIRRIDRKNAYEFHVWFSDREHSKDQKYVMKFKNDRPENEAAIQYILSHRGQPSDGSGRGGGLEWPVRVAVELDLNGNNCRGTLIFREDKIVFETSTISCSDRAFTQEWDALKSYQRVSSKEILLTFYKYGRSAPDKITRLRFFTVDGPIPSDLHHYLSNKR